ncbi:MAG TPA: TOPRIM nucleotidyl transferase/hydrolase domain-containing protein [Acidimicrobiia bacterium]
MAVTGEVMGGDGAVLTEEIARARVAGGAAKSVILVEGVSDQRAIETLAMRQHRDLASERAVIIPIAGATNIGRFLDLLGPRGHDVRLAGLCDEAEAAAFQAAFSETGLGSGLDRAAMEELGFFVCSADLEEELIRALGAETMVSLIASQDHLRRFRSFQNQPAQRHKTIEAQLWRWLGNHKIRYAPLMVEALDMEAVPHPLEGVLASV